MYSSEQILIKTVHNKTIRYVRSRGKKNTWEVLKVLYMANFVLNTKKSYWNKQKKMHNDQFWNFSQYSWITIQFNPLLAGIQKRAIWQGGASDALPRNKAKIKLQRHVRIQIRGFWGCQTHLDYCQVSYMCGYTHVILYQGCQDQNSVFGIPMNHYFDPLHDSVITEIRILNNSWHQKCDTRMKEICVKTFFGHFWLSKQKNLIFHTLIEIVIN